MGAREKLQNFKRAGVTIVGAHSPTVVGFKNANAVAETCLELSCGLMTESPDGAFLVFPPRYVLPTALPPRAELGHVPSWIRRAVIASADRKSTRLNSSH